jgi:hypothetical protein
VTEVVFPNIKTKEIQLHVVFRWYGIVTHSTLLKMCDGIFGRSHKPVASLTLEWIRVDDW